MIKEHLKVTIIGPLPNPIDGCSYANEVLCENFDRKKIVYSVINTNTPKIAGNQGSSFSIKKTFCFFKAYFQIFKILKSDVVYFTPGQTFYGVVKYSPFFIICVLLGKSYVIHVHGNYLGKQYSELKGIKKKLFYKFISKAQAGIVLSKSLRSNFKGLLEEENIYEVENFASNEIYESTKRLIKKKDTLRILYLSNLMEEKGILDVLEACLKIKNEGIDFELNLAGVIEESIKDDITNKIKTLGNNVNYLGVIKGEQKNEILKNSNIFILPTYYKMEGQPISIIEALATGNIIITTKHAGIPDIVTEKNGYFVQSNNPKELAGIIKEIGSNIDRKVNQFSHYNCHYAMNNYTEEKFSSKIIEILNKVNASKVRKI